MPKLGQREVRIIAGKFKGRKIHFIPYPGLRPTPDRVRETLFNWLANDIVNAKCLDLFAGSGALGFEALSRGALHVTMVDLSSSIVKQLQLEANKLHLSQEITIIHADSLQYLSQINQQFDIVFLDPPFHGPVLEQLLSLLQTTPLLHPQGLVYLETATELTPKQLPQHWQCLKQRQAGQVYYGLYSLEMNLHVT